MGQRFKAIHATGSKTYATLLRAKGCSILNRIDFSTRFTV